MSTDVMNFDDVEALQIPVRYGGKGYILVEASGSAATKYKNQQFSGVTLQDGKPTRMQGMATADFALLASCLYEANPEGNPGKLAGETVIGNWPNRVIAPLLDKLKKISELDEAGDIEALVKQRDAINDKIKKATEDKAKNAPSNSTDGSDLQATTVTLDPSLS